jgi:peptide chain release factor
MYLTVFLREHPGARIVREQGAWFFLLGEKRVTAYQSVVLELSGEETVREGTVKWICRSPLRPHHRRRNWFIMVSRIAFAPLSKLEIGAFNLQAPDKRLFRFETFRCPGKGGQNVNKVETGARVIHLSSGLTAASTTARTQLGNKKLALQRLQSIMQKQEQDKSKQLETSVRERHDRLNRGNAFAAYSGIPFLPLLFLIESYPQ